MEIKLTRSRPLDTPPQKSLLESENVNIAEVIRLINYNLNILDTNIERLQKKDLVLSYMNPSQKSNHRYSSHSRDRTSKEHKKIKAKIRVPQIEINNIEEVRTYLIELNKTKVFLPADMKEPLMSILPYHSFSRQN